MKFFRLKADEYKKEFYRHILPVSIFLFPVTVLIMLILKALGYLYIGSVISFQLLLLICLAVAGLSIFSMHSRFKEAWKSYILILDGNLLIRRLGKLPEISVNLDDILQVVKDPNRGLEIKGASRKRIFIPLALQGFEELEKVLCGQKGIRFVRRKIHFVIWLT